MLSWIFVILLILAVLFILMSIEYEGNPFWNLICIMMATTLFFILALSVMEITEPYQIYNATSGNIETGYHEIVLVENVFLSYIFTGLGVICMIYLVAMVYDKWINYKP